MHRNSFGATYANGGRSPYQTYTNPPARDQLPDLVDYIAEDYSLLTPSQTRVIEDEDEPDRVHITYRGETWRVDFPPFSIAEEKVQVYHVRERVAGRLGVDMSRIRLIYKGRELRRDDTPLKSYGCKQNSEITVVISSQPLDHETRKHHHSGSDSDSVAASSRAPKHEDTGVSRSGSTYRRRESDVQHANGYLHPAHHNHSTPTSGTTSPRATSPVRQTAPSPTRTTAHSRTSPPDPTIRNPSPRPSPTSSPRTNTHAVIQPVDKTTPVGKIQQLRYEFHTTWVPQIHQFIRSPPMDKEDRNKEYLRLNEIVSQRVFDRGDAIETEGPEKEEMRAIRRTLYAEANDIQKDLDKLKPREAH